MSNSQGIVNGTWVTMVTPFNADYTIDYKGVEALIEWYINKGVDGIFAVCQSSEMFYLSLRERAELARFITGKAKGRIPVVVSGHVSDSLQDQIEELRLMAECGPDAVVLVSNRLAKQHQPDSVWKAAAGQILEALPDVSFGIYECPFPYKRLMSPELLEWCASTGRFTFLKDTCCSIPQLKEKIEVLKNTGFKLFNANAATLLESLKMGASGFSGVMLNFQPELYAWLCRNWANDPENAARLQSFATVSSLIELQLYPVNAKYYMSLDGVPISTRTRSKDDSGFGQLQKIEVQALFDMWQSFEKPF